VVPSILTPGERVVDKKTNKKYMPILDAIHDNKIDPELLNGIAMGKYNGGSMAYVNDNKEVVEAIKGLPVHEWNVTDDELARTVKKRNSRITYVSERYRSKGR
jgi:predicted acylesterase/phospholipase RssA